MTAQTTHICDRCGGTCKAFVQIEVHVFNAIRRLDYCSECWPVYAVDTARDHEGRARNWLNAVEHAMKTVADIPQPPPTEHWIPRS